MLRFLAFATVTCAVGCSGSSSTAGKSSADINGNPSAQSLINAYNTTLSEGRFRFEYTVVSDGPDSPQAYTGVADLAHDAADFSATGAENPELRFVNSGAWVANVSGHDPQTWLIVPKTSGDAKKRLRQLLPNGSGLAEVVGTFPSAIHRLAAATVHGVPTTGYEWTARLAGLPQLPPLPQGTEVRVEIRLDSLRRVHQLEIVATATPIQPGNGATPTSPPDASSTSPSTVTVTLTVTLYDFDTTPPITAPPSAVTVEQLNNH